MQGYAQSCCWGDKLHMFSRKTKIIAQTIWEDGVWKKLFKSLALPITRFSLLHQGQLPTSSSHLQELLHGHNTACVLRKPSTGVFLSSRSLAI